MRRRNLLKAIGGGYIILSAGPGLVVAEREEQQERAKKAVASESSSRTEDLEIVNEAVASWSTLDEHYYNPKLLDTEQNIPHRVLIDGNGNRVGKENLNQREIDKYRELYGKFTPDFAQKLEEADDDEEFEAVVWLNLDTVPWQNIVEDAKRKDKEGGREAYFSEYRRKVSDSRVKAISEATQKIAERIDEFETVSIEKPRTTSLSIRIQSNKEGFYNTEEISSVARINEVVGESEPRTDSATKTYQTYDSRKSTFNADGIPIGVAEPDQHRELGPPFNLPTVDIVETNYTDDDISTHASVVMECLGSYDDTYPGAAYNADIYAADEGLKEYDTKAKFFDDNEVVAVNASLGWNYNTREYNFRDCQIDQTVYSTGLSYVVAADDESVEEGECVVGSPAKAFNVLSVGSINDQDTGDNRSDDTLSDSSCSLNPLSRNNTDSDYPHHKPEVAGVGENIYTESAAFFGTAPESGNSFATPGVSAMYALQKKHMPGSPYNDPERGKAITMASATHHVGDTDSFDRRGTGCIDADSLLDIANNGWWITDRFDEGSNTQEYTIDLQEGDEVKIVLCWMSNITKECNKIAYFEDIQSDINLDMYFYKPNGDIFQAGVEYDRGWQYIEPLVDYISAPETGSYTLSIYNSRWDASESSRLFTLAWHKK